MNQKIMKNLFSTLLVFLFFCSNANAWGGGKRPCSGKKGGISHCVGNKFMCKNGTLSKSKKTCSRR